MSRKQNQNRCLLCEKKFSGMVTEVIIKTEHEPIGPEFLSETSLKIIICKDCYKGGFSLTNEAKTIALL